MTEAVAIALTTLPSREEADPKSSTGNCFLVFFVWISVSISKSSSKVPKPPGKATSALAR